MSNSDPLYIGNEMAAVDRKDRSYWDKFTDEERKKFSAFLMIRWTSTVDASGDMQAYYLISVNERLNRNFFALSRHPKLQWLVCTTVSPGMGRQRHSWLAAKKRDTGNSRVMKFLAQQYPDLRDDELRLLADINDRRDIAGMARELGWDDQRIKTEL